MYSWFDEETIIEAISLLTPTAYTEYILKAIYCPIEIFYLRYMRSSTKRVLVNKHTVCVSVFQNAFCVLGSKQQFVQLFFFPSDLVCVSIFVKINK